MQPEDQAPDRNAYPAQQPYKPPMKFLKSPRVQLRRELFWGDEVEPGAQGSRRDMPAGPTMSLTNPASQQSARYYQRLDDQLEPRLDTSRMSTVRLMQLSGILQVVRPPQTSESGQEDEETEDLWIIDGRRIDPRIVLEETVRLGAVSPEAASQPGAQPAWKAFLAKPAVKVVFGGLIGIAMLFLVSRFVNIPTTIQVLRKNLTTPQGILNALLASFFFMCAFSIRGTRWKMFLRPIRNVPAFTTIRIYWIGVFMNVLLPVQGGEIAKSLMLKRTTGIAVSQSLPTVAMDKALDLMPALIIMAVVPFIPGIHMSITLWLILGLVSGILISVIVVVALTAWNRAFATALIQKVLRILPGGIGGKIEGFAMGFVDSLLVGASQPKIFIPAILLTCAAITCDGLFAMFAFWTVGLYMNFGAAIFGYTVFNMFTILPTPPGQVGSNEVIGPLVFSGLLGFNSSQVLAMFVFSHPLTALIMAMLGLLSLSSLGLRISSVMKSSSAEEKGKPVPQSSNSDKKQMAAV